MFYQITPKYCFAVNPKVGCTSFSRAIVETHYPELFETARQNGVVPDNYPWILLSPLVTVPDRPVVLLVRNPVDRFISAICQTKLPAAVALDCLLNDGFYHFSNRSKPTRLREDEHFRPQSRLVTANTTVLLFPDQIQIAANLLQLGALPHLNQNLHGKPTLTAAQTSQVNYLYAADLELFQRTACVRDQAVQKNFDL
jgi:hypothetical protein